MLESKRIIDTLGQLRGDTDMDRIKFFVTEKQSYPVDKDLFERKTRKSPPFYQDSKNNETSQFAVCPECNNPVQVIGLYKSLNHTEKPFAKHCGKPIPGIGYYNSTNYEYCPYRAKRQHYTKESRKGRLDEVAVEIIRRMVLFFDKIIYLLQSKMGFFISPVLAEQMLRDFFNAKAYLYPGATLRNMPLILANFSLNTSIVGRKVFSDELANCINQASNLYIDEHSKIRSNQYSNAGFYFLEHKTHLNEHHLSESIVFKITQGEFNNGEDIYEKRLDFDNSHIENLLNYTPENISEYHKQKNATLLEIAQRVASDYGFQFI
ncbi:hypothetical protein [Rodentibacter trehalosifermentans]|uniref:hypothetical protein n=1 Tax=Rodentibacter trehalosifermentans TaxID=1908263 RepID=UPI00117A0640|nr:hypothetical protein [Rodentibacter trehalosifermentans]